MNDVFIRDEEELEKKINLFKKEGLSRVHIVSDFDRTLTDAFFKGKSVQTSYSLIREGKYLGEEYSKEAFALFDKYHPYEIDPKLSLTDKLRYMDEWWNEHLKIKIKYGLNKKVINDIVQKNKTIFREGFFDFSNILVEKKLPFLILSAGLGDIIKGSLEFNKAFYSNIKIIANFYDYDNNGFVKGYINRIINPFNKNESSIKNSDYFSKIKERTNVILLGDALEDLDMLKGAEYKNLISIGFLNDKVQELLPSYSKKYDLLILNDSSMNPAIEIIKRIIE